MPGLYRIDVPDLAFVSGVNQVTLMIKGYNNTNGALVTYQFTQELMQVDMTQIYPNTNTAGTVGDALNAARSGAFGKRLLIGRNINYYAPDEITITKTLELDSASAPLVRQENVEQNASITNSGLVFYLDAANSLSYPGIGTTWYDLSGRGNHASLGNGATWVSAGNRSHMSFDGIDDFLSFAYDNSLFTNEATVIAWLQVTYPLIGAAGFFDIGRQDNYYPWNGDSRLYIGTFTTGRVFNGVTNNFNKAENHMVALSIKPGIDNYKLYQNAVVTASQTNLNSFTVSNDKGFSLGNKFYGKLFHVLLYNRALTDAEITSTFNSLKSRYISTAPQYIPANGLMMYLDAADPVSYSGTGNIWYDISGNGFNATLLNGAAYVNNGTAKHFYLDNINDRINFSITSASFGSSATVIFWTQKDSVSINSGFIDITTGDSWYTYAGAAYIATFKNTRINNGQGIATPINIASNHMVSVTTTSGANGYNIYQNDTLIWNEAGGAVNIANSGFGVVRPFGGKVYAVMIYNRVLSANEISTIYNSMKSRYGL